MRKAEFRFSFEGIEDFKKKVQKYKFTVREEIKKRTVQAGYNIQREARLNTPVEFGFLKNSIRNYNAPDRLTSETNVEQHYAPYVEFGTGTLVRVPRELRDFAWQFKGKGVKQVNLPARPFLYPAFFSERKQYLNDLQKIISETA